MAVLFDLDQEIIKFFEAKGRNYSEVTVMAWAEVLSKFDPMQVMTAFNKLKMTADSFVDVGKIVEIIQGGKNQDAEIAWERCLISARADGRKPIHAKDARALNSLGGMEKLCLATNEDLHWLKKDFLACYGNFENSTGEGVRCFGLKAEIFPDPERQGLLTHG